MTHLLRVSSVVAIFNVSVKDWFHDNCIAKHSGNQVIDVDSVAEIRDFVCYSCMCKLPFLMSYKEYFYNPLPCSSNKTDKCSKRRPQTLDTQKQAPTLTQGNTNLSASAHSAKQLSDNRQQQTSPEQLINTSCKKPALDVSSDKPRGTASNEHISLCKSNTTKDTFFKNGWREAICTCATCHTLYVQHGVEFLMRTKVTIFFRMLLH